MKVGVIGSGAMGSGIAQVAATAGETVVVFDSNKDALIRAENKLIKILDRLIEKGRIDSAEKERIFGNIQFDNSLEHFTDCELVIEAIIENLEIKQEVFKTLESIVPNTCILASNTSSLSIASIGSACDYSERVVGIHFFNPAPLMPLVEIIPSVTTSLEITERSTSIIASWKKVGVLAKDTPGFIVNRVARPFYGEALRIYEEGIADFATIDWAMKSIGGFRMGPFELMDYIGNDINYTVTETVFKSFYNDARYKPSFTQKRLSEAGLLGRKSGKGYYDYNTNDKAKPNEDIVLGTRIFERILVMLINEAVDALFWNIASKEDIDTAMTKGVNYPKGLIEWGSDIGWNKVLNKLEELRAYYCEDRYRPSPLLRKWVKEAVIS